MAKGWKRYRDYDQEGFAAAIKASRQAIKALDSRWTLDYVARQIGLEHRGTLQQIEAGIRSLSPKLRYDLFLLLEEGLQLINPARREELHQQLVATMSHETFLAPTSRLDKQFPANFPLILNNLIDAWEALLHRGVTVDEVARRVRETFVECIQYLFTDVEVGEALGRLTILFGRTLAMTSPYQERWRERISTYDFAEKHIFLPLLERYPNRRTLNAMYARLLLARATSYRCNNKLDQSWSDADRAINYANRVDETWIVMEARLRQAHIYATEASVDQWQTMLRAIKNDIADAKSSGILPQAPDMEAYWLFFRGKGYRRLAYQKAAQPFTVDQRIDFARRGSTAIAQALLSLEPGRIAIAKRSGIGEFHPLNANLNAIECDLWHTASLEEVRQALAPLEESITREYPALLNKYDAIQRLIEIQQRRARATRLMYLQDDWAIVNKENIVSPCFLDQFLPTLEHEGDVERRFCNHKVCRMHCIAVTEIAEYCWICYGQRTNWAGMDARLEEAYTTRQEKGLPVGALALAGRFGYVVSDPT